MADARSVCFELAKQEYIRSTLSNLSCNASGAASSNEASDLYDASREEGKLGWTIETNTKEFKCLQSVVALQPDLDLGNERQRAEKRKRMAKDLVASGKKVPDEGESLCSPLPHACNCTWMSHSAIPYVSSKSPTVRTRRRYRLVSATRISIPGGTGSKGHWMLRHELGHAKKEQVSTMSSFYFAIHHWLP